MDVECIVHACIWVYVHAHKYIHLMEKYLVKQWINILNGMFISQHTEFTLSYFYTNKHMEKKHIKLTLHWKVTSCYLQTEEVATLL